MFKLNQKETHNRPIEKLLQNGFRFALVSSTGAEVLHKTGSCSFEHVLKAERYAYKLDLFKKQFRGSKVIEIKTFLRFE